MGNGAAIGTLLGGAVSLIPGMGAIAPLLMGGSGLLGGLFDGADTVDTTPYLDRSLYLRNLAQQFYNPGSKFYTTATKNQRNTILDMYLAGVRARKRDLASKGISSSAINSQLEQDARTKASESVNQFGENLYQRGMAYAGQLESGANNMLNIVANLQAQNTGIKNSFKDQFMDIGASLLGQYLGSLNQPQFTGSFNGYSIYKTPLKGWGGRTRYLYFRNP